MLRLIIALALTIVIENAVLLVIGVREKDDFILMTLINIVTNIPANILYQLNLQYNIINNYICVAVLEAAVVAVERLYMKKYMKTEMNPLHTALIVNAASFLGGIIWNYFL